MSERFQKVIRGTIVYIYNANVLAHEKRRLDKCYTLLDKNLLKC